MHNKRRRGERGLLFVLAVLQAFGRGAAFVTCSMSAAQPEQAARMQGALHVMCNATTGVRGGASNTWCLQTGPGFVRTRLTAPSPTAPSPAAAKLLRSAQRVVVFTGAGMSRDSGIAVRVPPCSKQRRSPC